MSARRVRWQPRMLSGNRVRLRPKKPEDALDDYNWSRDPELAKLDGSWPLTTPFSDYYPIFIDTLRDPSPGVWPFAIDTLDGKHIGNCMLYAIDEDRGEVELGIMIGDREYWDQGYGEEATKLLLEEAFGRARLHRVYLHTLEWNYRAQRCFEKVGFTPCGNRVRAGQKYLVMEALRSQWERRLEGGE